MGVSNGVGPRSIADRTLPPPCTAGPARVENLLPRFRRLLVLLGVGCVLVVASGCQGVQPVAHQRLIEHQALIDFAGLKPAANISSLKVVAAVPQSWEVMPTQSGALYTHGQWRSLSTHTGVGAAYVRLPLPFSAKTVLWLARQEYSKKSDDGKIIAEWTDELGRNWFEAENNRYHVRGYALAQGFEAWIIYFGYKVNYPPDPSEISLAARCADSFVPMLDGNAAPTKAPVSRPATRPEKAASQGPTSR